VAAFHTHTKVIYVVKREIRVPVGVVLCDGVTHTDKKVIYVVKREIRVPVGVVICEGVMQGLGLRVFRCSEEARVVCKLHTVCMSEHVSIRQHTLAYVSIRQHTSAYEAYGS